MAWGTYDRLSCGIFHNVLCILTGDLGSTPKGKKDKRKKISEKSKKKKTGGKKG